MQFRIYPKVFVDFVGVLPVNFYLLKEWEFSTIFALSEGFNFGIGSWLLIHELVTRECKDFETMVSIFLVELYHLCVALVSQASVSCDINNHNRFLSLTNVSQPLNEVTVDVNSGNVK
jgi:hypothetical protein